MPRNAQEFRRAKENVKSVMSKPRFRCLAVIVSTGLALAGAPLNAQAEILTPANDPFYVAPADIDQLEPGAIIRSRSVDISIAQAPLTAVGSSAYQVLYRTGDVVGTPIANVTTIVVPDGDAPEGGRQLVSVQNAENSLDPNCAPSYQLQVGQQGPNNAVNRNLMIEMSANLAHLAAGRVLVVPDALGPKKGYIVRTVNAHMVLDSIRAAVQFEPAGLPGFSTEVALWGYSGGGWESAAANELHPTYAPELNIVGVAAGGVPAGTLGNIRFLDGSIAAGTLMAVAEAVNRAYPEMDLQAALNDAGKAFLQRIQIGCSSAIFAAPMAKFDDWTIEPNYWGRPSVRNVLMKNALGQETPTAPTLYYHAVHDEIVWISPMDELVAEYCAEGAPITYIRDQAGAEHIQAAGTFAAISAAYLNARFSGIEISSTCGLPVQAYPGR